MSEVGSEIEPRSSILRKADKEKGSGNKMTEKWVCPTGLQEAPVSWGCHHPTQLGILGAFQKESTALLPASQPASFPPTVYFLCLRR